MSSGLPHHPQQSLQSLQSLPPSPFALSYLFPTPTHSPFAAFAHQQRIKLKRSRQRVDAGEPRNSYQQPPRTTSSREDEVNMSAGSVEQLTAYFPWMKNMEQTNINEDEEDLIKEEQPTDLSINGNGSEGKDDSGEYFEELDKLDVVNTSDEKLDDSEVHDAPVSTGSAQSSVSSASKRKSFLPQRNVTPQDIEERELEEEENLDDTDPANDTTEGSLIDGESKHEQEGADNESTGIVLPSGEIVEGLSALQSQLSAPSQRLTDMMEAQRRIYAQFAEQQRSAAMNPSVDQEKPRIQKQFGKLAQTLKQEVVDALTLSIDKIIADFAAAEVARLQAEAAQAIQQHQQQQQQQHQRPMIFPAFPGFQPGNHMGNPFGLAPPVLGGPSGIFPNAFNPFANPLAALNAGMRRPNMDDDGPRKKRNKVTDCFRARPGFSCSSSPRQSPQLSSNPSLPNYFPPTMVGHPLYGGGTFDEREESPTNSDEMSDCGGFNDGATSHTLTPMHLRKAKLMFFFTRYPNSSLLKSYFPDIRFNKNNTAQLVKWFSNFREFYYIQIEKMAKQALAEGVKNREDIHVTKESDIFKQLNQHYNRNNHIEAPDRLVWVVQETLREFFVALQNKRDEEPSWKKPIYKVICRLDDPIPEYFKDPNFLDRLE